MGERYRPDMGGEAEDAKESKKAKSRGLVDRLRYALKVGAIVAGTAFGTGAIAERAVAEPDQPKTEQKDQDWTEEQQHQLREMWQHTNNKVAELDSVYFSATGESLPVEVIDLFQKKGNEFAASTVKKGGTVKDFDEDLDGLFGVFKKSLLGEGDGEPAQPTANEHQPAPDKPEIKPLSAEHQAALAQLEAFPDSVEYSYGWLQGNAGKVFQRGGKIIAVASARSSDRQVAYDKADLNAAGLAANIFRTETRTESGVQANSSVRIRGGRELHSSTHQVDNGYETFIVIQYDVVEPAR
ncbi:MAG: hypothetical protein PHY34_05815 [Patescibacteria group bacterium]|nr:hypothetical protein [Patescibacteria group bacterium]MDD5716149.1 hypothetical protein [Patescibacteria group bacterium]